MVDAQFLLNSRIKLYQVDSEKPFTWFEREKLPKTVQIFSLRNIIVDTNHVEQFEWQLKMSRQL